MLFETLVQLRNKSESLFSQYFIESSVERSQDLEDLTRRILEPFEGTLVYAPSWES